MGFTPEEIIPVRNGKNPGISTWLLFQKMPPGILDLSSIRDIFDLGLSKGGQNSPIYIDNLSGDEVRGVRGEKYRRSDQFFRLTPPSHGSA